MSAAVADIAYHNKRLVYDLLMRISAETTLTIAADPKHLGARIGITSVLHTWGSAMTHHPHVCSTEVMPTHAPRCLGSAAMVSVASALARISRS